jgi:hypothetical protein
MKKTLFLLLIMVILTTTTSVALAKSGKNMDLICWINHEGDEESAYFMTTGNGIVHRFKEDGRHDIYKLASEFDMPGKGAWDDWKSNIEDGDCETPTQKSHDDYLTPDIEYWHQHN